MQYEYTAYIPRTGKTLQGTLEAPSETAAEQALWQQDAVILTLAEVGTPPPVVATSQRSLYTLLPTFFGVRRSQVMQFTRQLAALTASGVGLLPSLQVLQQQTDGAFRLVLDGIVRDIQSGLPLSDAIAKQPTAFPSFFERMVRVGEKSGNLELVLRQIFLYMEREQAVRSRVSRALAYPIFIFIVSMMVVALIMSVALPTLISLYNQFQAELPLPTRLLITIVNFVRDNALLLILLAAAGILAFTLYVQTDKGRLNVDGLLLRMPLIGPINVKGVLARYTRTLCLLLRAGLSLVDIMELVESTVGNRAARRSLAAVRGSVMQGQAFSAALMQQPMFPPMLAQMVRVGEETGKLDTNLEAIADLYEEETDRAINTMTGVLEPTMTILMGLLVGFIALSTVLPIYSIMRHIH